MENQIQDHMDLQAKLNKFNQRFAIQMQMKKNLMNQQQDDSVRLELLRDFRDLWIELTMVMQENEDVKGMSDRKFF